MFKVVLVGASLMLVAGIATAGIIDPCGSTVEMFTDGLNQTLAVKCYFACPQGDTATFRSAGFWFAFLIKDLLGNPVGGLPATDFWLVDCDPAADLALCAGSASSNADSATNSNGRTTMSQTTLAVGGCVDFVQPVVQGLVFQDPASAPPCQARCYNLKVRSCDLNGDLKMDLIDLSSFAGKYPPQAYNKCADFDCNGVVNLQDLSNFALHYAGHKCI